jgi:predicted nucleotide-binding protein
VVRHKQAGGASERTKLLVTLAEARARLQTQLERGRAVPNQSINENDQARRWYDFTAELLRQISTTDELQDEFTGKGGFSLGGDITTGYYLNKLNSIYERLELFPAPTVSESGGVNRHRPAGASRRVFVVHGHDDGVKETVARFLGKLELEPIVLHEQPSRGRTIIEKFEDHSDVAFAVVLFTPDDIGYPVGAASQSKPRARQNVVLELGFFLGALGRARVCVLYNSGVELPSDYSGVLYQELDAPGAWRFHLAREIKASGIAVDLNNAI